VGGGGVGGLNGWNCGVNWGLSKCFCLGFVQLIQVHEESFSDDQHFACVLL